MGLLNKNKKKDTKTVSNKKNIKTKSNNVKSSNKTISTKTIKNKSTEKIYPRDEFQKNLVTGHPAHIEGYSKRQTKPSRKNLGDFLFRNITHKKNKKNHRLKQNPNPKDNSPAYIDKKQSRQKVELFKKDSAYKDYKLSKKDKKA